MTPKADIVARRIYTYIYTMYLVVFIASKLTVASNAKEAPFIIMLGRISLGSRG